MATLWGVLYGLGEGPGPSLRASQGLPEGLATPQGLAEDPPESTKSADFWS